MKESLNIGFIGNPNCGKTTLFNAYTGAKLKVANWPGVSVEKKEGVMKYHNQVFKLVDLPGIYSLTSYSMEEKVSRQYILDDEVDVVIDVADASSLERNLYLTLQLIELGKPVILALNMMDIIEERGMEIDLHRLPEMLGIPVIPVSARKKRGLDILMHAAAHHKGRSFDHNLEHHHDTNVKDQNLHKNYVIVYSNLIEEKIEAISCRLRDNYSDLKNVRWHAIKLLEKDNEIEEKINIDLSDIIDRSYEVEITNEKYDFIEEIIEEVVVNKSKKVHSTDKVDSILTNKYLGIPFFFVIMALVFFLTFTVGDLVKGVLQSGLDSFTHWLVITLRSYEVNKAIISLFSDGIVVGVGTILTFLPNIFILFLALAFLEDSGYMARVAYVMDEVMGKVGLSGRAFIPMLLGFGCTVPAVMASRTLENDRDRFKTILLTPFMSCSAKLPIYILFSGVFFKNNAMIVAYSMYLIGIIVAISVALIMNKIEKKDKVNTLLIELPEYKAPNARTISIYVWDKVKGYLGKAGTTIFIASIVVWFILNFNIHGMVDNISVSFGASFGKLLVPILKPAGLGMWQVAVALIAGMAAKEIVASSFTVLFASKVGLAGLAGALGVYGFGALNAYSLMVFSLLYTPCIAAVATIKKETSLKYTIYMIIFQLIIALSVSTLIYQIGSLFI